jgi:GH18 family chitinase
MTSTRWLFSYAKWFPLLPSEPCDVPSGLGCKLVPLTEINSGAFRYDTSHNGNWGGEMGKIPEELWTKATKSFENNIVKEPATGPGPHYDTKLMADSMYDQTSGLFWTWQSPHAISQTCEALKKIDGLGGQFVFSLGQDRKDLAHHTAWTTCVAGW